MNLIEHIVEPERLLLVWRPPIDRVDRTWRVVAEIVPDETSGAVLRYCFGDDDFVAARREGFSGYPAFPIERREHREGVLDAFVSRLPPRSRRDFTRFMNIHALDETDTLSPLALLGYCGAALPSDGFMLMHPFDRAPTPCEFVLEVAGARHYMTGHPPLAPGTPVRFVLEPTNEHDPRAVRVEAEGRRIGYVSRAQTAPFHDWLAKTDVRGVVHSVNGSDARPRITVFVTVAASRRQAEGAYVAA